MAHEATESKDRLEVEASACSSSLPVLSLGTELSLHLRSDGLSSQLLSDVFRAQDQKRKRRLAFFCLAPKTKRVTLKAD